MIRTRKPSTARIRATKMITKVTAIVIGILGLAFLTIQVWTSDIVPFINESKTSQEQQNHQPQHQAPATLDSAPVVSTFDDYIVQLGAAQVIYTATPGVIEYCPLDDLGRTVCAYGGLTPSLRDTAKAAGRQDITTDPSGWPDDNNQALIPALPEVSGSKDYNGWFWNRSHLIADSLGGDAIVENLVTGTRTQNVGSVQTRGQYSGGMAHTELIARDYLDSQADNSCPLYYAATPQYRGEELIPRSVRVDLVSCDKSVNVAVEVINTANNWVIDYFTGAREPTS